MRSGVHCIEIGGLCVYLCATQKQRRAQAGGGTKLLLHVTGGTIRWNQGVSGCLGPVTHEAAQWDGSYWGVGVKLMTWCVTETHHLSVIQVFELQGCNVARLVRKDLFQIAGPEGSVAVAYLLEVFFGKKQSKNTLRRGFWM